MPTTATFSWWTLTRDINNNRTTLHFRAIQSLNRCLRLLRRGHLYETKASLSAGRGVEYYTS
jgi:hypothetical protein